MDKKVSRYIFKMRGAIEGKLVLIFDSHNVAFTHFKLDVSLRCVVLKAISQCQRRQVRNICDAIEEREDLSVILVLVLSSLGHLGSLILA